MVNIRNYYPKSEIHLLTNAGKGHQNLVSIEALIERGFFNDVINYEKLTRKELTEKLQHERYDLVIHLTQYNAPFLRLIRDMIYFRFIAGIKSGFGWQHSRTMIFRQTQEKYLLYADERSRLNAVLEKNGILVESPDKFPFYTKKSDFVKIEQLLASLATKKRPAIAIVAGAKRPQNRWPVSYFEAVIRHFCKDFDIYLIGGPEDANLTRSLSILPNVYNFCGLLTPIQSGLLMQRCLLVLTNDTGPMHIAYSFGASVVAIFSNRDFPGRWYPPDRENNIVVRADDVSCSVCLSETCNDNICMKKITPDIVIDKMNTFLTSKIIPSLMN